MGREKYLDEKLRDYLEVTYWRKFKKDWKVVLIIIIFSYVILPVYTESDFLVENPTQGLLILSSTILLILGFIYAHYHVSLRKFLIGSGKSSAPIPKGIKHILEDDLFNTQNQFWMLVVIVVLLNFITYVFKDSTFLYQIPDSQLFIPLLFMIIVLFSVAVIMVITKYALIIVDLQAFFIERSQSQKDRDAVDKAWKQMRQNAKRQLRK
jgi:hypothetical protein